MNVNILTTGRFHVLDLARELTNKGCNVKFYTYVPKKRCASFGLEKSSIVSFFYLFIPFFLFKKVFNKCSIIEKYELIFIDILCSLFMNKCDVFISMSGVGLLSLKVAKKRYGAKLLLERGSKHILEQIDILSKIPQYQNKKIFSNSYITRELKGYELADIIVVGANHVKTGFKKFGINENKLFVNPYGVNLKDFYSINVEKVFDVIMVGNWTYQKGCDLLVDACLRMLNLKFLHVGELGDVPFPIHPNFKHIDPVDQLELVNYYSKSRVFALPSRQEGNALVQSQALACGIPIVCSKHTGGIDIAKLMGDYSMIFEMTDLTVESLEYCLIKALEYATKKNGTEEISDLSLISWESYGERYFKFLNKIINV